MKVTIEFRPKSGAVGSVVVKGSRGFYLEPSNELGRERAFVFDNELVAAATLWADGSVGLAALFLEPDGSEEVVFRPVV